MREIEKGTIILTPITHSLVYWFSPEIIEKVITLCCDISLFVIIFWSFPPTKLESFETEVH